MAALDDLATPADLTARNITVPEGMDADELLDAASAAVRDAAGCPILSTESTVDLVVSEFGSVTLPGHPVTDVSAVAVDGVTVDQSVLSGGCWSAGWRRVGNELVFTRYCPWPLPATLTVTYTHGLASVPKDIVDLVCGLVSIAAAAGEGDYGGHGALRSFRLGEFAETYSPAAGSDSPSPMSLPDSVRERLRARFGGNAAVLRVTR